MAAMCGLVFKANLEPGDKCPDGSIATAVQTAVQATPNEVSGSWNQDATPTNMDRWVSSPGYSENSNPVVRETVPAFEAQDYFNRVWGLGTTSGASQASKDRLNGLIGALRNYSGSELGTRGSVEQAWNDAVKDANRSGVSVFSLLGTPNPAGSDDDSSGNGPGGGGRGYSGPVSTVTNYNEADLRIMADSIGSEVLGRGVTDQEFKKVLAKVRAAEAANPSVSGGAAAASMTNVSGLSQQGREDVMTRALLKQNGAEEFTLATKMMGLFNQALEGRPDA